MQSNALTQTSYQNPLLLMQMHSRNHLREAEGTREIGLNERIASLEERLQSILQVNQQIEAELNQARALYEERQQRNALSRQSLLDEIRPLEEQVEQLTPAIAALVQTNTALDTQVQTARVINEGVKSINAQVDAQPPRKPWRAIFIKQHLYKIHGLDKAL